MPATEYRYCGQTSTGAEVFAVPAFLDSPDARHDPADAIRYAEQHARPHPTYGTVVAVLIDAYRRHEFGPSGTYWTDTGLAAWFSCPGGMRHGAFYNVEPGVGPQPATDRPRPTRDAELIR